MSVSAFSNELNDWADCIIGDEFEAISQKYEIKKGKKINMVRGRPRCGIDVETSSDNKEIWSSKLKVSGLNIHDTKGDYLCGMTLLAFRSKIEGKVKKISRDTHGHGGQLAEIVGDPVPAICIMEKTPRISQTIMYQKSIILSKVAKLAKE